MALGVGLGLGEAATLKANSQTLPVVACWTGGMAGAVEALGLALGVGVLAG